MSQSWQRVEQLFHEALELDPGDRGVFLFTACAGDDDVRRQVESLLNADQSTECLPPPFVPRTGELVPGQRLDRYEIVELSGRGGMGAVYRARDPQTGQEVAIKIFPAFVSPEQRRRYMKEAQAASALNHPYVVSVYQVGRAGDQDFIVMEYVDGKTLAEAIPPGGVPVERALGLARMIVEGLAAAHAAGIVHRDLKPANLMVKPDGSIKILDFGLAKFMETGATPSLQTATGQIVGTVCYLSPEQAQGKPVDTRSDVFSFGVVLYEMLTGERPFDRGSLAGTLRRFCAIRPSPCESSGPELRARSGGLSRGAWRRTGRSDTGRRKNCFARWPLARSSWILRRAGCRNFCASRGCWLPLWRLYCCWLRDWYFGERGRCAFAGHAGWWRRKSPRSSPNTTTTPPTSWSVKSKPSFRTISRSGTFSAITALSPPL